MPLTSLPARTLDTGRVLWNWFLLELAALRLARRDRTARTGNRVVMLADQMPPVVSGGTYRPLSFAVGAPVNGWEMTVFARTPKAPVSRVGADLAQNIPPEVDVYHVADVGVSLPLLWRWDIDGGFANALKLANTVRQTCTDTPDIVLATGPRFHGFVAGLFIKKALGSKLVLDYRDEWSECPFHFVRKGPMDRWWERRCLAASDFVIFTTPTMMEHALRCFPGLAPERCAVIENGVTGDEIAISDDEPLAAWVEGDRHSITFMGNLSDHTDPTGFLATLSRVIERRPGLGERVRLLWVGTVQPRQRELLGRMDAAKISRILPQVSPRDAHAIMRRSSLLLLLVNREMDRYRPGKLYSYLATDTPILVYGSQGESGRIVKELSAGFVVEDGDDRALEAVLDCLFSSNTQLGGKPEREAWARDHRRDALARRLFKYLDDLL